MKKYRSALQKALKCINFLIITGMLVSCSVIPSLDNTKTSRSEDDEVRLPLQQAEVFFTTTVSTQVPQGDSIFLNILDEVTGIAINPKKYSMDTDDGVHFYTKVPVNLGSVVKYRYTREGATGMWVEHATTNEQVRYRLLFVESPIAATDIISAWSDTPFTGETGRIQGKVLDMATNQPLSNMLITIGGKCTITSSDGSYLIEGLAPGKHILVAYNIDGAVKPFQQEAIIAEGATTPANFMVPSSKLVRVTFSLTPPENSIKGLPIRLVGNTYPLGNTFADLSGGVSTISSRAPLLNAAEDGTYSLTLELPVGLDLRYKYSLGDGFWNAEHKNDGSFMVRQLIVPDQAIQITDTISRWSAGDTAPISFNVIVPSNTPAGEQVSIQFNPYTWMEPITMWPIGNHEWMYILYSPLELVNSFGYRYCRNDQCGVADDIATHGFNASGWPFSTSLVTQTFQDDVTQWADWTPSQDPISISAIDIKGRGSQFMAGVEFSHTYNPNWQSYLSKSIQRVHDIGSNWVVISPTWHYSQNNPPVLSQIPGKDMMINDLQQIITWAHLQNLQVALYPTPALDVSASEWWEEAGKHPDWWQQYYDDYKDFIVHFADLAAKNGVNALIVGGENVIPSVPGMSSYNLPMNASANWDTILTEIESHYSGQLVWASPFNGNDTPEQPVFMDAFDSFYVEFDTVKLAESDSPSQQEMSSIFGKYLDDKIKPLEGKIDNKPIIIGVSYGSFNGAGKGCLTINNTCLNVNILNQPHPAETDQKIDLLEQADIYNAALIAINERDWIDGFISQGYYPPVLLQDHSASIYGKPASDILWYWFPRILNGGN
jgi:hypothetical protein